MVKEHSNRTLLAAPWKGYRVCARCFRALTTDEERGEVCEGCGGMP
jgi:hypothetical protein